MATTQDRINGLLGDLGVKPPVLVATTAPITLSGEQTIDGVAIVAEDRVLVKDQVDQTTNGIYYCQLATWVRAPDFDGVRDSLQGTLVFVATGTTNARTLWALTTVAPVIGTSNLTFAQNVGLTASAFIQTLLDDTTAAQARITLGAVGLTGNETVAGIKTFSSSPVIPTPAVDNNTTNAASTAFVLAQAASATPLVNAATAVVGTSTRYARGDHVHPQRLIAIASPVATSSGTSVSLSTVVPSWARRIILTFNSVSTNGTAGMSVRIGPSGGLEATGYVSSGSSLAAGVATSNSTTGFIIRSSSASAGVSGIFILEMYDFNNFGWAASHTFRELDTSVLVGAGIKTLAAALTQVSILSTDTFDGGAISVTWE